MSELVLYIIIGVIWAIISLIQKANKKNKENTKSKSKNTVKNNNKKTYTNKKVNNNEEEIFRELKKNMESLKNYSEDTLRKNTQHQNVYTSNYETSNNDREMLELQQKYNSKISQINNIKKEETVNNVFKVSENKIHVNHMLSSLDIKNAVIYNAILEPKRINYTRKSKIN